jgi:hypothetical protein
MSDLGRYRQIYVWLWRHPGFRQLSSDAQRLTLYLLSGPQTNRVGVFAFSVHSAADDLGNTPRTITKGLADVASTFGWMFDAASGVFFIPSWWRWNPPANANVLKGNLKDISEIAPCSLVDTFARNLETLPEALHQTFLDGLRQRLLQRSPTQDQYQESGTETGTRTLRAVKARTPRAPSPAGSDTKNENGNETAIALAKEVLEVIGRNAPTKDVLDTMDSRPEGAGLTLAQKTEAIAIARSKLTRHG